YKQLVNFVEMVMSIQVPKPVYYVGKQSRGVGNQENQFGSNYNQNFKNQAWGGGGSQNNYKPVNDFQQPLPQQENSFIEEMIKQIMAQQ
ncbi:hypothetical protein HAX54_014590, partial [Datura stramonium]|nr:hypothetical protein [Datura stramonium]